MRIGELAERSGFTAKTIRFYEQTGVLPEPGRTSSGYRDYGEDFVERLGVVRRARVVLAQELQGLLLLGDKPAEPLQLGAFGRAEFAGIACLPVFFSFDPPGEQSLVET